MGCNVTTNKFETLHSKLLQHKQNEDIKLAYQYCGGAPSKLADGKRMTFQDAIVREFAARFAVAEENGAKMEQDM